MLVHGMKRTLGAYHVLTDANWSADVSAYPIEKLVPHAGAILLFFVVRCYPYISLESISFFLICLSLFVDIRYNPRYEVGMK